MIWWICKGTVILAIAFAASALLKKRPAALRHAVWAVAIAAQLLIPLAPVSFPSGGITVPVPSAVVAPPADDVNVAVPAAVSATTGARAIPWRTIAMWILRAGSALIALRLLLGTARVILLARRARRIVDGSWLALATQMCGSERVTRPVVLLRSCDIATPVTWGIVYPAILLPESCDQWSEDTRRHVLLHELGHVKRLDALTQLIAQIALIVFWFNPLLWLAAARMRDEAEHAADDCVLRRGARPSAYAGTLLSLVTRQVTPIPSFATLSAGRPSDLEKRVSALTNPVRDIRPSRSTVAVAVVVATLVALPLAVANAELAGERRTLHDIAYESKTRPEADVPCRPLNVPDAPFRETSGRLTDGGESTWYFFLRPSGRCLEASISLDAQFTADDRDFAPTAGLKGFVREVTGSSDRVVFVQAAGGLVQHRYVVDGRERIFDAGAREWYTRLMPQIVRRTSAGVDFRTRRILERDGVQGLLDEIARIPLTEVRSDYLETLVRLRPELNESLISGSEPLLGTHEPSYAEFVARLASTSTDVGRAEVYLAPVERMRDPGNRVTLLLAFARHRDSSFRLFAMDHLDAVGGAFRRDVLAAAAPWYLGDQPVLTDRWIDASRTLLKRDERRELLEHVRSQELPSHVRDRLDALIAAES